MPKKTLVTTILIYSFTFFGLLAIFGIAMLRPWHPKIETEFKEEIPKEIKVGYLPIYVDLPLFVAVEEKIFEQYNLKVELVRFESSPDIGSALVSNRIDAGASIATSSAMVVESRDPGVFSIFLVDAETPENYLSSLVVAADSEIKIPRDLEGKSIASFPGPTAKLWGPLALKNLGVNVDTIEITELPIGGHISALRTGRVSALITYEPQATQLVMQHNAKKLVPGLIESNVINPWQAGVWVIRNDFYRNDRDTAERFIKAIYDAVDFIRKEPEQAKLSLEKYTSIKDDVAQNTPTIPFTKYGEIDVDTLQKHVDMLFEHQTLSKRIIVEDLILKSSGL